VKGFLSILGLLGLLPGVYALSLLIRGGGSGWMWAWMVAWFALCWGCAWLTSEPLRARIFLGIAGALLAVIVGVRGFRATPSGLGSLVRLPDGAAAPWATRLVDDADATAMLLVAFSDFGGIRGDDWSRSKAAIKAQLRLLRRDREFRPIPSIVLGQLLGQSPPAAPLAYVFNPPPAGERAARAIIFMHGTGGAQKLPCWMLARRMPDAMVVCPAVGLGGEWANDEGQRAFETAIQYVTERAGAVYVLAHQYAARGALFLLDRSFQGHIAGVVLLSGMDENYFDAIRRSTIPLLVVRGNQDQRTPVLRAEGLGGLARVRHLDLDGGNLLFYEQADTLLEKLDEFFVPR